MKKIAKIKKYAIAGSLFLHINQFVRNIFTRMRRKIDFIIGFLVRKLVYKYGIIQDNKIFVMTFDDSYSCNPRYIVDEILRRHLPVEIVWVVSAKGKIEKDRFPIGIKLVRRGSYTMFEEMGKAKIWLDNALNCVWYGMPKKKEQIYINTWHGSMGIKKLSGNKTWLHRAKRCKKITNYCISNSTFEENIYRETFWPNIPCLKFGHARNDIFFNKESWMETRRKVVTFFFLRSKNIEENISLDQVNLFLYAPTFRDNGKVDFQDVDYARLKETLKKRFGGEWVILVRTHFKERNKKTGIQFGQWLKDASCYPDMQELLTVADAGMTDYSSWAYDYILTRRPLFLYVPDLSTYDQTRGFYYPLESTPFPISQNNAELESNILHFDEKYYLKNVEKFLIEKGCYEDGHASERIANLISHIVKKEV